ncbi:YheC/YheD family protein [Sporosarcina ureilytica]|uniref:ATP-grasp domain-containing protein n=1 Tax=Sporosarcina ureilytica TaxID=298596 RepID=A0A1D8JGV1_9BACL|nr:YheC/YheD family protein [Sporosarcina ureilytica]AOV07949.1 hypothetical protein BI350_10645 [Sporosarcina ureilytica]
MKVVWLPKDTNNHVYVSHDFISNGSIKKKMELQFGNLLQKVTVEIDEELPIKTIAISENILKPYTIPTNLPYEVIIDKGKIKVGPVIGIMVSYSRFFNHFESIGRIMDYKHIKGLLFIFRPRGIDLDKNTISGYYYNPSGKTKKTRWIEGTFPFPDVIYNRWKRISDELNSYLTKHEISVFNSHYLNKWQQYEIFSESDKLKSFLPETRKLTKSSLSEMIGKYDEIYVKPTSRANGDGIKVIEKKENRYVLIENNSNSQYFNTINALYQAIKRKNYIIQPSVAFKSENRNLDFRVLLQKDGSKKWSYSGIQCRVSIENSIITNFKNKDYVMPGLEALRTFYHLSSNQAKEIEKDMAQLCKSLAEAIEAKGVHLGDVAFDIIVDSKLRLWVLEIQIRYGVFDKGDVSSEFFHKFMVTPLYYAKALAGF